MTQRQDIQPDRDPGFGVISTLRREQPALPVFVWTYNDDTALVSRVVSRGARACIHKLKREDLMSALEAHGIGARRRARDEQQVHS